MPDLIVFNWYMFRCDFISNISGIFAPVSKIAKPSSNPRPLTRSPSVKSPSHQNQTSPSKPPLMKAATVDVSSVKAKVNTGKKTLHQTLVI